MTFTTFTFVAFLSLVFGLYWLLKHRQLQNGLLVLASYSFYAWWDWRFCSLMLVSSLVDFFVGLSLERSTRLGRRRSLLLISLLCNLGLLGFFKYFHFFTDNFLLLAQSMGWEPGELTLRIVLPVGISFYTFQTLSYTIDIYRGQLRATRRFIAYLAYVSFFPQLVAGPIERAPRLLPQFLENRRFDPSAATDGCRRILWGFFKKMALADNLGLIVDQCYAAPGAMSGPQLAFATFCFAFQIYCDFSAYSDIAIGTARLFGIDLMRNFAYPYFSQSVGEFWRRWHISLSTWFRDYVFIPLGGSRGKPGRVAGNIMATFLISGLWHGASWNFIIWGGINGLCLLPAMLGGGKSQQLRVKDTPGGESLWPRPQVIFGIGRTFLIILAAWVFFRAQTFNEAMLIFGKIGGELWSKAAYEPLISQLAALHVMLPVAFCLLLVAEWLQRRHDHPLALDHWPRFVRWLAYSAVFWLTLMLGPGPTHTGQFIYFQF